MGRRASFTLTVMILISVLSGCTGLDVQESSEKSYLSTNQVSLDVTWTLEGGGTQAGTIVFELYPDAAPYHVENFILLIEDGYYNNTIFHRIIQGFMAQGGDFTNFDGTGGHAVVWAGYCNAQAATNSSDCSQASWTLPDEADNGLKHEPYVLSMAKTGQPNSGGSQFFIVSPDSTPSHLDGVHTVFGRVIDGFAVVDALDATSTDSRDKPIEDVTIVSGNVSDYEPLEGLNSNTEGNSSV